MRAWRFRLQKVLEAKQSWEDRRQLELARATQALAREERTLAGLQERNAALRLEVLEARRQRLEPRFEAAFRGLLERFAEEIHRQQEAVAHCRRRVVEKRTALLAAMTERKALEKLRERDREAHRRETNAREQTETDEIGGTAYRRRQNGGTAA